MPSRSLREELGESWLSRFLAAGGVAAVVVLAVAPVVGGLDTSYLFYLMFWVAMALSVNLVFGYTGYIPFGYFAFYGVGAYGTAMAFIHLQLPMVGAVLVGGGLGVVLGVIFLPMFRVEGIYFAIATFAAAWAIKIGITLTPEGLTGAATGLYVSQAYDPTATYYAMFVVTVAVVLTTLWLDRSRYGTMLRAMRDDPIAVEMSGINRARLRSFAWMLSVFFPAIIGGIDTWNTTVISPEGGFDVLLSIKPILYALFGGPGTLLGPILGASTLYVIDDILWSALPLGSYFVTGIMLMVVVLVFPRGILGEFEYREALVRGADSLSLENLLPDRGEK